MPFLFREELPETALDLMWADMKDNGVLRHINTTAFLDELHLIQTCDVLSQVRMLLSLAGLETVFDDAFAEDTEDDPAQTDFGVRLKNTLGGRIVNLSTLKDISASDVSNNPWLRALLASTEAANLAVEDDAEDDDDSTDDEKGLKEPQRSSSLSSLNGTVVAPILVTVPSQPVATQAKIAPLDRRSLVLPPTPPSEPRTPRRAILSPSPDCSNQAVLAKPPKRRGEHPIILPSSANHPQVVRPSEDAPNMESGDSRLIIKADNRSGISGLKSKGKTPPEAGQDAEAIQPTHSHPAEVPFRRVPPANMLEHGIQGADLPRKRKRSPPMLTSVQPQDTSISLSSRPLISSKRSPQGPKPPFHSALRDQKPKQASIYAVLEENYRPGGITLAVAERPSVPLGSKSSETLFMKEREIMMRRGVGKK